MANLAYVATFSVVLAMLMRWAFRELPGERWQIVASIPRRKAAGHWEGTNLTLYGIILATATLLASLSFLVLMGSIGVPYSRALPAVAMVLTICVPAASLLARLLEGTRHTFSVAGATAIGLLIAPVVVAIVGCPPAPTLAAMVVAYALGESVGRLGCISFGCCYGRPLASLPPRLRRIFGRFPVAFHGETKKIAYAGGLAGIPVLPIQAMTAIVLAILALAGTLLFLAGHYRLSFALTFVLSQVWRVLSETLRADHRGGGRVSPYQVLAGVAALAALGMASFVEVAVPMAAELRRGIVALWDPTVIVALEAVWMLVFVVTGWSMVTGSVLSFRVHRDRV